MQIVLSSLTVEKKSNKWHFLDLWTEISLFSKIELSKLGSGTSNSQTSNRFVHSFSFFRNRAIKLTRPKRPDLLQFLWSFQRGSIYQGYQGPLGKGAVVELSQCNWCFFQTLGDCKMFYQIESAQKAGCVRNP